MSRPEYTAPPELFYNDDEAGKYTKNSRVQHIQAQMTLRALDLLDLQPSSHVLDIGSGSGLSGEILSQEGHTWIGMDISASMLAEALDRNVVGDMLLADMGQGVPFRAGSFDAAVSISAIQWLGNADTSGADPKVRLKTFFQTLFGALKRGGKVCCQFYPTGKNQLESIMSAASATGFAGGVVIDNEQSKKNKKYYLVLTAGATTEDINLRDVTVDENGRRKKRRKDDESQKDYIMRKKETMQKRGKAVARDSKYTGRKRKARF